MPFRAHAAPVMAQPCLSENDFLRPRHSTAWAWHGVCELASAIQIRHVSDLPAFGFFRLPRLVSRSCYQKHTNPLNCRTSSSDISGYHADFREGHCNVGERQGHGMVFVHSPLTCRPQRKWGWVAMYVTNCRILGTHSVALHHCYHKAYSAVGCS
jgi:hypothetical protein